jgi:VWFA-related protein
VKIAKIQATVFLIGVLSTPLSNPALAAWGQAFLSPAALSPSALASLASEPAVGASVSTPFNDGVRAINESRWADAVAIFSQVAATNSDHADGALYWKAYAENKQGQANSALETCTELRRDFPHSRWIDECGALEIEIRAKSGQPMQPQALRDENLKLLALNALLRQDEAQALTQIRAMLASDSSERLKKGVVQILAESPSKPAQELLHQIVNHKFAAASLSPAVQATAVAALEGWLTVPQGDVFTLDAVVTDKAGQPVSGLAASDFTLLDNNWPQTLLSVQEAKGLDAGQATEVILVVDAINTTAMAQERVQLERFLLENNGQLALPTSLFFLSDWGGGGAMQTPSTRDGKALEKTLRDNPIARRLLVSSMGGFGAAERQLISLRALNRLAVAESKRPGRKLLIWISPAWPVFWEADHLKTQSDEQELFTQIVTFSSVLREARMTLYSIDPLGEGFHESNFLYQEYRKGVTKAADTRYGDVDLRVLSEQSGGRVLMGSNDLAGQIDRCIVDARDFYVLRFKPFAGAHPDEYHTLSIQVDKPGVKVLTRTGYYAQP